MKNNIPKISPLTTLVVITIIFLVSLLSNYFSHILSGNVTLVIIISSILSGLIITFGINALSPVFTDAIVVMRRLLRFESLSNPLLLELAYKAPGTFHHSINVSILGQKAAKSIGADTLLVRVGAYYHDLGKLLAPTIFIENQSTEEVPQGEDAISVKKSAQRLIMHVKKGIEIAETNHLPHEIIDMISEHHGTTKVLYFFEEAKKRGLKVRKTDFKYQGPTPQSKESGILMLADSVEAAARAVTGLTRTKISEIVQNTIAEKIKDSQLKRSCLSKEEIATIAQSLTETLLSIYHQRLSGKSNE